MVGHEAVAPIDQGSARTAYQIQQRQDSQVSLPACLPGPPWQTPFEEDQILIRFWQSHDLLCPTERLPLRHHRANEGWRAEYGGVDRSCIYACVRAIRPLLPPPGRQQLTVPSIAGGETVAAFLAAVTFYLCKAPLVLRRLQQEIRTSFPTYALIDSSRALQLSYLQAVIREGLRIYPPSPQGLPRVSPGAAVDGCWVPKGVRKIVVFMCYPDFSGMIAWLMASNDQAEVYTSTWTVHHSQQYFEDPDEFLPERWLVPRYGDIKEASQPFSVGPRGCIGRK